MAMPGLLDGTQAQATRDLLDYLCPTFLVERPKKIVEASAYEVGAPFPLIRLLVAASRESTRR
jgi:hypothetical protein